MSAEPVAPSEVDLTTPIALVAGVGSEHAAALRAMGLTNVGRLVAHLPTRHEREEAEATIDRLEPGRVVSTRGEVTACRPAGFGRAKRFEAVLCDETGRIDLVWFNMAYLARKILPGVRLRVQGKAQTRNQALQIVNPTWELLEDDEPGARDERLRPVYPATEAISSRQIERAIGLVLPRALQQIEDHLPGAYRRERELPELSEAYRMLHAPESEHEAGEARRRLAYDELLLLQLGVALKRQHLRARLEAPALEWNEQIDRRIRERLPFELTPAQEKVVGELARDLSGTTPTNRLVQGDVGSGKTAIALYAMLMAVAGGHQAALMAPTELLAEQHLASIESMLRGSQVRLALLTGSLPDADRRGVLAGLREGTTDIVVGTHALLTGSVEFAGLGVAVIDEQHRFGVEQRAGLRVKGMKADGASARELSRPLTPHVIVMTATPIPRSIGLTLFGDLDLSVIDGMPPGRTPIETRLAGPPDRAAVYADVRARIEAGDQAYVVVPAIDTGASAGDSELNDLRAVQAELERGALAGRRVAALHGRLKRDTRAHVMERFRQGQIDCLVATTVIEVGVDVPNATTVVVEHAERFGLAQLHQLRGRVGRGTKPGLCVLIGDPTTEQGGERLRVMTRTTSGFDLAERDLEIRGPGEVFGSRQSGAPPFRVADLVGDAELLAMARRDARAWIERSPKLDADEDGLVRRRLLKAHGAWLGLGDVG